MRHSICGPSRPLKIVSSAKIHEQVTRLSQSILIYYIAAYDIYYNTVAKWLAGRQFSIQQI